MDQVSKLQRKEYSQLVDIFVPIYQVEGFKQISMRLVCTVNPETLKSVKQQLQKVSGELFVKNQKQWSIYSGNTKQFDKLFKNMDTGFCSSLGISSSIAYTEISTIIRVNFPNLKMLKLTNTSHTNCQFLSFMNAPVLQRIAMIGSSVVSLNALHKLNLRHFRQLIVHDGHVKECDKLSRLKILFATEKRSFWIMNHPAWSITYQLKDLTFFLKLQTDSFGNNLKILQNHLNNLRSQLQQQELFEIYRRIKQIQ